MKTIPTLQSLHQQLALYRQSQEHIAFVPTMGNLHAGHMQLVEKAKQIAKRVVVSIFVNPKQFGPKEDYNTYPRTLSSDCKALEALGGVDVVFTPQRNALYPLGDDISVHMPELEYSLCGESRPHFFSGVLTILLKLFNVISPHAVVMGEKDLQQLILTRRLVDSLLMPIDIIGVPTVREGDGLAMSSRNNYLNPNERTIAPQLYQQLSHIKDTLMNNGQWSQTCIDTARTHLTQAGFKVDYIAAHYADDLSPIAFGTKVAQHKRPWAVLGAAFLGNTRLIDNCLSTRHDKK